MFEERVYLPHTARRLQVTNAGEVLLNDGQLIETFIVDNELCVEVAWVDGVRPYRVALLVLAAYGKLDIEDYLWDDVDIIYKDDSKSNLHPINLTYKFRSVPYFRGAPSGYARIPGFAKYCINVEGDIRNIGTGDSLSWHVTKGNAVKGSSGGYRSCRLVTVRGQSKLILRHRALCLAFKPCSGNPDELIVNHIDGIPGHDNLDNLEWSTYSENNFHAYRHGLRPRATSPVLMRNLHTGETTRYVSIAECGRQNGVLSASTIQLRLARSSERVFPDGLVFKYDDGSPWGNFNIDQMDSKGLIADYVARDVFTGDTIVFRGTIEGEKLLGVKAATILSHARSNALLPHGKYNFRYLIGGEPFPSHTEWHLRTYKAFPGDKKPDPVIAVDLFTGEEIFFLSRKQAAIHFSLSPSRIAVLACSQSIVNDRYKLRYFKLKENLGPIDQQ